MSVLHISVDIEADGPYPGDYSMIELGACVVEDMDQRFITQLKPISRDWAPEALAVSGYTREETLAFMPASTAMHAFRDWLNMVDNNGRDRLVFVSDNPVFDGMFVWWYFGRFGMINPFGFSGVSITSLYKGFMADMRRDFRRDGLRRWPHTHNALDDAVGNAEAFKAIMDRMAVKKLGL